MNFIALLCVLLSIALASTDYVGSVTKVKNQFIYQPKRDNSAICNIRFTVERNETGWNHLFVDCSSKFSDEDIAYAAGYIEGSATAGDIYLAALNLLRNDFDGKKVPDKIVKFFKQNMQWVKDTYEQNVNNQYWEHVHYAILQAEGLIQGFFDHFECDLDYWTIFSLVAAGELADLVPALLPTQRCDWYRFPQEVCMEQALMSECTAVIRVLPDKSDIVFGHNLWTSYSAMLRIFKHFNLPFSNAAATTVSFSSKPGDLRSKDDYYLLSSKLSVFETSLPVLNDAPYKGLTPIGTIPTWIRVLVANRLSKSGKDWTNNFKQYNSGTHNNQWLVLDNNLFTKGQEIKDNTLFIVEQIPKNVFIQDLSFSLRTDGWFAGFNIPYFKEAWVEIGYADYYKKFGQYGSWFKFDECPRFKILSRDLPKVKNFDDLRVLLRDNNWVNDPLSDGYPFNQLAARWDLIPNNNPMHFSPQAYGAVDAKCSSTSMLPSLESRIIGGPTNNGTNSHMPPFSWNNTPVGESTSHLGQPLEWNFDWITVRPF
eukprot:TRINITY_DN2686_c0_g1_i1.p1 TRINITY_DN2686_c0_g1~~TRINITY_DN2686_c0_g1_i1.p1  ORF type:complete len:539 (+),score=154.23 TRINITY_DN2686_c0_g1_i1:1615-3231(+)